MFTGLFWLMLVAAGLEWFAAWREWRVVRWFTKPGTLILLLAWFTQVGQWRGALLWFGMGLAFSLAGDVLLLLRQRFFMAGIAAFFLAHISYIIGFNSQPLVLHWGGLVPVLIVGGAFTTLNGQIRSGLKRKGEAAMTIPVMAYAGILSLMWLMALSTLFRPDWSFQTAALVSVGAGLFFLSDSILAFGRFVRPVRNYDFLVMTTYHLAQILIASGVLLQFA